MRPRGELTSSPHRRVGLDPAPDAPARWNGAGIGPVGAEPDVEPTRRTGPHSPHPTLKQRQPSATCLADRSDRMKPSRTEVLPTARARQLIVELDDRHSPGDLDESAAVATATGKPQRPIALVSTRDDYPIANLKRVSAHRLLSASIRRHGTLTVSGIFGAPPSEQAHERMMRDRRAQPADTRIGSCSYALPVHVEVDVGVADEDEVDDAPEGR